MSADEPSAPAPHPRKLILEITGVAEDGATYRTLETFPAYLGRGFHNDVIIQDPHASADHVRIDWTADGFAATDLGSVNGTNVNARAIHAHTIKLAAGDTVRIGRTDIRVFTPDYKVPPALKLQRASAFLNALSRSVVLWPVLALCMLTLSMWAYLQTWTDAHGQSVAITAAAGLIMTVVWAALWAVAGKLIRHKGRFRSHVSLFSIAIIVAVLCYYVQRYADFLLSATWLYLLVCFALNTVFLAWLLSASLALATDMTQRRRRFATAFFSGGLMAALFALTWFSMQNFNQAPSYASQLEPYLSSLAHTDSPQAFTQKNAALFASDVFNSKPDDDGN